MRRAATIFLLAVAGALVLLVLFVACIGVWFSLTPESPAAKAERERVEARQAKVEAVLASRAQARAEEEKAAAEVKEKAFQEGKGGKVCREHPSWSRRICEQVAEGSVYIGMTKEQVTESMNPYTPKVHTTVTAYGTHEQWIYVDSIYVYFDNGVVTAVQD